MQSQLKDFSESAQLNIPVRAALKVLMKVLDSYGSFHGKFLIFKKKQPEFEQEQDVTKKG